MRRFFSVLTLIFLCGHVHQAGAQNPNWTLPGVYFETVSNNVFPLPQSPPNPATGVAVTDPDYAYQGQNHQRVHGGYSDPWGNLLCFTVDENLYDSKGWLVASFRRQESWPDEIPDVST